ncbi:hypothetical protein [Vibrio diabolicus]|uniref:hypothetical protein n=1 Tax=Vibrio diabolicus TaxID=50719 RepID=UPI0015F446B4|nr:hypothetical protein [Vibrio diabolicus]
MVKGVGSIYVGLRGTINQVGRLNPYLTAAMAVFEASPGGSMSFTSLLGDSETAKWWGLQLLSIYLERLENNRMITFYQNLSPSNQLKDCKNT